MLYGFFLACSPGADDDSAGVSDTRDDLTVATVTYYIGTSQGQAPDGSYVEDEEEILFIRALDPHAATIGEEFWIEGARGAYDHGELLSRVATADGSTYTFSSSWDTADGALEVAGEFTAGQPWAWTAWHSTSTYMDGKYIGYWITSDDVLDAEGADTATKVVYDAEGTDIWHIIEVISPVPQADFESRLAEIGA